MRVFVLVVPNKFTAAEHVEVEVWDLLSSVFTVVGDETVPCDIESQFLCNFLNERCHLCHGFGIDGLKVVDVHFGNDQYMYRCFWVKVMKRKEIIVFMDGIVGDLSLDDFTEYTHGISPSIIVLLGQL